MCVYRSVRLFLVCSFALFLYSSTFVLFQSCGPTTAKPCSSVDDCLADQRCDNGKCVANSQESGSTNDSGNPSDNATNNDSPSPQDSSSGTDNPPCVPATCQKLGANCGTLPDGCGQTITCGTCKAGEVCGANNKPNVCGQGACTPTTCQKDGAQCGEISDGCGNTLNCGSCQQGYACGSGAQANRCVCQPQSCQDQGKNCGSVPDGCGKTLNCGTCKTGEVCGANNKPNVCGKGACQPKTCSQLGAVCGTAADGCGKTLTCGNCKSNERCEKSQCVCQPTTCQALKKTCGQHPDGCGKTLDCGTCPVCKPSCPSGYQCDMGVCSKGNPLKIDLDVKTFDVGGQVTLNGQTPKLNSYCRNLSGYRAARVYFNEINYGYSFTFTIYCKDVQSGTFTFKGKVFPGTYRVSVSGGTYSSTPTTDMPTIRQYLIDKQVIQANKTNFKLDVKTFEVGGQVTLNSQTPKLNSYCRNLSGYRAARVYFNEVTYGYSFTFTIYCKDVQSGPFNFTGKVFPGTYKVSVSGGTYSSTPTTDMPTIRQYLIDKQLIRANKTDFKLDVKTFEVGGQVTLNGQTPKLNSYCRNLSGYRAARVYFNEVNHGYSFTFTIYCKDVQSGAFIFKGNVFPGTYKVSVSGGTYSSTPTTDMPTIRQYLIDKQSIQANKTDFKLDVKTFEVGGQVTLNGQTPKLNSYCRNLSGYRAARVYFNEVNYGYSFTFTIYCKDVQSGAFNFKGNVFPGTYKVSVSGGTYSSTPTTDMPTIRQYLIDKQSIQANKTNFTLDVKTLDVGGQVTLNGQTPKLNSYCRNLSGYRAARVYFSEVNHGYSFTFTIYCKDVQSGAFTFKGKVFPGTYKISASGGTYSSTPTTDMPTIRQYLIDKQIIQANKTNFKLNVQTFEVSGQLTFNGQTPKLNSYCRNLSGYRAARVFFNEISYGYSFTFTIYCKDVQSGTFTFKGKVFPGTYKVSASGGTYSSTPTTDMPTISQVLVEKLKVP